MPVYSKNFKSIRDEVTFDMQAAAISEHEDRIIIDKDEEKYLPVSVIYTKWRRKVQCFGCIVYLGGKVLRPLFATEDSEEKVLLQKKIIVEPFAFSVSKDEPTEFELFFRTTVSEYRYILHVKRDIVLYESLIE